MRRFGFPLLVAGCLLAMLLSCFGDALFRNKQFAYRDAAHFYYPLYELVEREWNEGRWPLWEVEENGGMPLLGNPTAAVLYPGKLIYRAFRHNYAWGARLYVVAHVVLAFAGMLALLRSWGTSWTGSALGALGYAFGAPILFQYCNIIFLVGAAWTPLGLRAIDRWLRLGRRVAILELTAVLSMQTLGGDPESAYITGVCAGGYAFGLSWQRARQGRAGRRRIWPTLLAGVGIAVVWTVATLVLATVVPTFRPRSNVPIALPWMPWVPTVVMGAWMALGAYLGLRWLKGGRRTSLIPMLIGLAGAAALAGTMTAVQLLPVMEFTGQSGRAVGGGPHDIFPFSLEPLRLVEFVWPNLFGTNFEGNRSWLAAVPPDGSHPKIWVPSLYLGGLVFILAFGTLGKGAGTPWRAWLTGIAVVSLLISFGEFTSPIWWARWVPEDWAPTFLSDLGPHDSPNDPAIRHDGKLRDGDGGLYWFLAMVLPGFRQFRFPSKLLSFTILALAGLAGLGWDRLMEGKRKGIAILSTTVIALSLVALGGTIVSRSWIVSALEASAARLASGFGPLDVPGSFAELQRSLIQAAVVMAVVLALALKGSRRPALAGAIALVLTTTDLALANARYVFTVPQDVFETTPKVMAIIQEAERKDPSPGPYRIHRMPIWNPLAWTQEASSDRVKDFVVWERDTIQPKYGLKYGVQYSWTLGVAELWDYDWFFGGFLRKVDEELAPRFNVKPGEQIVYFPRRAFDLWNTRYFITPAFPAGWTDEHRGYATFRLDSERIYPGPDAFKGPDTTAKQKDWLEHEDLQVWRNKKVYPRAWVVHSARFLKPITSLDRTDREAPIEEMLFQNDQLWHDPSKPIYDPLQLAWVDSDKQRELAPYLLRGVPSANEKVAVISYSPQRVELEATLDRPGFVVLADVYYPGWRLTIDGKEAPVYRANRMMRGAAVKEGKSRLVYTFDPPSFRYGSWITFAGLATFLILGIAFVRWPGVE